MSVTRWMAGTGVPTEFVTWTTGFGERVPVAEEFGDCVKVSRSPTTAPTLNELLVAGVGPPGRPVVALSVYVPARVIRQPWKVA